MWRSTSICHGSGSQYCYRSSTSSLALTSHAVHILHRFYTYHLLLPHLSLQFTSFSCTTFGLQQSQSLLIFRFRILGHVSLMQRIYAYVFCIIEFEYTGLVVNMMLHCIKVRNEMRVYASILWLHYVQMRDPRKY